MAAPRKSLRKERSVDPPGDAATLRIFAGEQSTEAAAKQAEEAVLPTAPVSRGTTRLSLAELLPALTPQELARVSRVVETQRRSSIEIIRFRESDAYRPVDWRLQGALRWIHSRPQEWPKSVEREIETSVRLVLARSLQAKNVDSPKWIGARAADLEMHACLMAPKAARLRQHVELLVLAGLPIAEIASEVALSAQVIDAYERVFFDIRSRLQYPSAVVHLAIGHPDAAESLEATRDRECRRLAYFGGPHVARELLRDFVDLPKPQTPAELNDFLAADIRRQILLRMTLWTRSLSPDDPKHAKQLLKMWHWIRQVDQKQRRKRDQHDSLNRLGSQQGVKSSYWRAAMKESLRYFRPQASQFSGRDADPAQRSEET